MSDLDNRHRDKDGTISRKRGDARVDTLRKTYPDFAPGVRGDAHLETVRTKTGKSLTQIVKNRKK
jgi:hypothetical protein